MCIVSAVHEAVGHIPAPLWNWSMYHEYMRMKKAAEEFDRLAKQPDCIDPAKEQLVKDILEFLKNKDKLK